MIITNGVDEKLLEEFLYSCLRKKERFSLMQATRDDNKELSSYHFDTILINGCQKYQERQF